MPSAVNGAMLRVARQLRGFQQGEAAEKLGVTQAMLSRAENGVVTASEELLDRAQSVYDLPISFFVQNETVFGPPVSVHPMWRKKADVGAREMDRIVAELNLRSFHLRKLLEATDLQFTRSLPRLDIEAFDGDVERIAGLVRAHWQIPDGPVKNLTQLVEASGVIVVHSDFGGADVDGVKYEVPGLPPIVMLNSGRPADRMRLSLAHELGHIVMHRVPVEDMEEQAYLFAGCLLMPTREMRAAFSRRVDMRRLAELKPEWKVSMQALLYRAKTIGAVSPNQARYLWQQFNIQRIRHREPPELDFPVEQPSTLSKIVALHLEQLGYTLGQLAEVLHVREPEMARIYGLTITSAKPQTRLRIVK